MKRLAVLLVGEYRTWPIASAAIFNFFNNRAEQIDYYFVTWNKSGEQFISDADITDYFQNKNFHVYSLLARLLVTYLLCRRYTI